VTLVVLAVLASVGAGVAAERRAPARTRRAVELAIAFLLWAVLPFVAFFILARLELTAGVGAGIGLAYAALALVGVVAYLLATRVLRLDRPATGALVCAAVMANTGYLGIPLNATLLGEDALAPAIAFDSVVSGPWFFIGGFAIGAAFGTAAGEGPRERARAFLTRNPPLLAVVAGLLAPDALAPDALVDVAEALASYAVLPLAFFALGATLAREPLTARVDRALGTAIALRIVLAPAVFLGLTALVADVPDAYRLQAAMPTGINSLIVAHATGLDLRLCATAVAWTTAVVVATAAVASVVV
jgi:hypothetical protein